MRVALSPELFEPPIEHTQLVALLGYGFAGRHRIDVDVEHPAVRAWLEEQAPGLREELQLGLDESAELETREPSQTRVEVVRAGAPDFDARPVRLPLAHARQFLGDPFVILLEDAVSDRAFLECMLTAEERALLRARTRDGHVRFEHGGGVTVMTRRVRECAGDGAAQHALWLIFDSDAMRPGHPSAATEELQRACGPIPHYRLQRRYIESYLPKPSLHAWAVGVPQQRTRDERLGVFRAFHGLAEVQRHHYNMKHGFARDAKRTDATAGALYEDVSDVQRRALATGFGDDIGALFGDGTVSDAALRAEGSGWDELRPVVLDLLARIR